VTKILIVYKSATSRYWYKYKHF